MTKQNKPAGSFFRSRVFVGILCLTASALLFAAGLFLPQLTGRQTTVLLLTADVKKGALLTPDLLVQQKVFTSSVRSQNPLSDPAAAQGKYAVSDLYAGDVLTAAKISPLPTYNDPALYELPEGRLAISVSVDALELGLSDKLIPGDAVTVFAAPEGLYDAYSDDPALPVATYPELRYVKVIAVSDSGGYPVDNAYRTRDADAVEESRATAAVTFEVNEAQALLLANIQARGHFHLALAGRGANAVSLLARQDEYFREVELLRSLEQQPAEEVSDE